jgi:hypothetical protein
MRRPSASRSLVLSSDLEQARDLGEGDPEYGAPDTSMLVLARVPYGRSPLSAKGDLAQAEISLHLSSRT